MSDSLPPCGQSMEFSRPEYWSGSMLSLSQGISPTQESNRDLLHCRWILYQLSIREGSNFYRHTHRGLPSKCTRTPLSLLRPSPNPEDTPAPENGAGPPVRAVSGPSEPFHFRPSPQAAPPPRVHATLAPCSRTAWH